MSKMGYGYGSEWHLLRYLGYHRSSLNKRVAECVGSEGLEWLDFHFNPNATFLDAEWKGVEFLEESHPAQSAWTEFWPQRGNMQNWDAVGQIQVNGTNEWLLVEAKANTAELRSDCQAKPEGGLSKITDRIRQSKQAIGASDDRDWLRTYYQYANRITTLRFLLEQEVPARLLFVYFTGDKNPNASDCPSSPEEWESELTALRAHLGLLGNSEIEQRMHSLFLPVCPVEGNH